MGNNTCVDPTVHCFATSRRPTAQKPMRLRLGSILALAGLCCLAPLSQGCREAAKRELRIAINSWPGYEVIYLAQEKGFFRESGVDVRLVEFGSLSDARRAYETGKVDGLATTVVEVLMARDATPRDLQIVRVFDASSGADVIVAHSKFASMSELRGKRVGVELASLGIYVLARALELERMTLADVQVVSQDQKTMREELLIGELDAVVTYPPESLAVLNDPKFRTVFSTLQIPGEVVDVLAMDGQAMRARPADVKAFLTGLDLAYDYLQKHPEDACRIMAEREGVSAQAFQKLLADGMTLTGPDDQAAFLGPQGTLRAVVKGVAESLQRVQLISSNPKVTECLAGNGQPPQR
jgi:NitT/TauT family transport system substrate-binding protein